MRFYELLFELIEKISHNKLSVEEIAKETAQFLKKTNPNESFELRRVIFFKCVEAMSHPIEREDYETLSIGLKIKPPQFFTQEKQPLSDVIGQIIFWDAPDKSVRGWYVCDGTNMFKT